MNWYHRDPPFVGAGATWECELDDGPSDLYAPLSFSGMPGATRVARDWRLQVPGRLRLVSRRATWSQYDTDRVTTETHHVVLPLWAVAAGACALPAVRVVRSVRRRCRRAVAGRCAACGYDLRATPWRCPECGRVPEGVVA